MRQLSLRLITITAAALFISGCSFSMPSLKIPQVHKITIQQGNVITQEMIDRLKPGMTRNQVAYIMGEPVIRNTFDESRWDYLYSINVPDVFSQQIHVTLFFENEVLAYFTGDLAPSENTEDATDPTAEESPDTASI